MVFGAAPAVPARANPVAKPNATMAFGAPAATALPSDQTWPENVGLADLGTGAGGERLAELTVPSHIRGQAAVRSDRTLIESSPGANLSDDARATPPAGIEQIRDEQARAQQSRAEQVPKGAGPRAPDARVAMQARDSSAPGSVEGSEAATLPPDVGEGGSNLLETLRGFQPSDSEARSELDTPRVPLELPPAPRVSPRPGGRQSTVGSQTAQFEALALGVANQGKRRNRLALAVIGLLALGVLSFLGWQLAAKRLFAAVTPAMVKELDDAVYRLRRDDSLAKQQTIDDATRLIGKAPDWVAARAALVLALALQYDDLQQRILRFDRKHLALVNDVEALQKARSVGWEDRVAVLANQDAQIMKVRETLVPMVTAIRARLQEAEQQLQRAAHRSEAGSPEHLATLRARAMVKAIFGLEPEAMELVQEWKRHTSAPDDWVDLVGSEAAANATPAPSAARRAQALSDLAVVRKRENNSSFLRPWVLAARLELLDGRIEAAQSELSYVLNLSRTHDVAAELLEWSQKAEGEAKRQ
jgi:hypothetical protein